MSTPVGVAVCETIAELRARMDAVELQARLCPPWPWAASAEGDVVLADDNIPVADGFALSGGQLRATVEHIAAWHPGAVLAAVAVDRLVLRLYEQTPGPELLEAVLAIAGKYTGEPTTGGGAEPLYEFALQMAGGSMMVRPSGDWLEKRYPLAEWIPDHQRDGGKVHRRQVIVVDDWQEVPRADPSR